MFNSRGDGYNQSMSALPAWPKRKRTRLDGFDYGLGFAYFITLCTKKRLALFGQVINRALAPSPAGEMIARLWQELPGNFPGLVLDVFAVMPDHFHAILGLIDSPTGQDGPAQGRPLLTLPSIVKRFKSITTVGYIKGVKELGWPAFDGQLWQRSYYDHVVRCDADLEIRRSYIYNNAVAWQLK